MDMNRMIFVTGFARGGTSWLRDCIAAHPEVVKIPEEMTVFRDLAGDRGAIEQAVSDRVAEIEAETGHRGKFVNKAPANAPHIAEAVTLFPEARFVFIVRDPRDVYISHKRGNQEWMHSGQNATMEGVLAKTRRYLEGYQAAEGAANLMLVRYEDLHQNFDETMTEVFAFLGLDASSDVVTEVFDSQNFWAVASRNRENRDSGRRKGVVGDWVNFLDGPERAWLERDAFWADFMAKNDYSWQAPTNETIFRAMIDAGVNFVDEDALLAGEVDADRVNVLVTHDVDRLNAQCIDSVLEASRVERELGVPAIFYFLPIDDIRYQEPPDPAAGLVAKLARMMRGDRPVSAEPMVKSVIDAVMADGHAAGLHLNAAERFFPADEPDLGNDHPDIEKAVAYLHEQVDGLEALGATIRTSSAHGYGRRKKRPNNRDTPRFTEELASRGVRIWDNDLRPRFLREDRPAVGHLTDVGGALAIRGFNSRLRPDDPGLYQAMPAGSVIHMLIHPGNYAFNRPLTLGIRRNAAVRDETVGAGRATVAP